MSWKTILFLSRQDVKFDWRKNVARSFLVYVFEPNIYHITASFYWVLVSVVFPSFYFRNALVRWKNSRITVSYQWGNTESPGWVVSNLSTMDRRSGSKPKLACPQPVNHSAAPCPMCPKSYLLDPIKVTP